MKSNLQALVSLLELALSNSFEVKRFTRKDCFCFRNQEMEPEKIEFLLFPSWFQNSPLVQDDFISIVANQNLLEIRSVYLATMTFRREYMFLAMKFIIARY